jgi:signal peptidase I
MAAIIVVLGCGLWIAIRSTVVTAWIMEGPSMEPTLFDGEKAMMSRTAYGFTPPLAHDAWITWASPAPGDVVVALRLGHRRRGAERRRPLPHLP